MEKAYKNTGYFMLLLIPAVLAGFYVTYFSHLSDFSEGFTALTNGKITIFHHLHATLATLWILLLVAQPLLIRYGKFKIHKTIGKTTYLLFPLLIISFILLILNILKSANPIRAYGVISNTLMLILFYSFAVNNKKYTPIHMRYMIATAFSFLGPPIGRFGVFIMGMQPKIINNSVYIIVYLILTGLILLDKKHGKNFKPFILVFAVWVIRQIVYNII
ncbi:hypothetical protein [Maribellus mangrovi]|uniref:hypothetical protein n=1 Tax=Maribellus mangrovi TaxID=3133146 RepID=UPI0030EDB1C8